MTRHSHRRGIIAAGCLLGVLGSIAPAATARMPAGQPLAGETCHGQPATVVGQPGMDLAGTAGPDVVVTNGATNVNLDAGDDLVCVTGRNDEDVVSLVAGEGADVVDASANEVASTHVYLGPGDDTYTGGPRDDFVSASDPWSAPPGDGADSVSTGEGDDWVSTGGSRADPDHDSIDLGPGRDELWMEGFVDPALPLLGGPGSNLLEFSRRTLRDALVIDNATGQATAAGTPTATWAGMERFDVSPIGAWEAPAFIGGPQPERVWTAIPFTSVDLGGGDDHLNLELQGRLLDHATYAGGAGSDSFILYADHGDQALRARLDIPAGRLLFLRDTTQPAVHARIDGFEAHRLSAIRLVMIGSPGKDHLMWAGCRGEVDGGRGADLIQARLMDDVGCGYLGEHAELVVRGGGGDDVMTGSYMPDTLLGGPGTDRADGRENKDRCNAETETRCER